MSEQNGKISLQDAIDWTSNWRRTPSSSTNAFLIPLADLQGAIAEIQNQSGSPMIRAYMAENNGEEKLVIVGTSQETQKDGSIVYKDLLPDTNEDYETATNGIWDFTKRCPPHCDPNSKLNN
ncbi:MAG: hypothetical protein HKM28_01440 [Flavobacteriaceae bacterium]|nr:hypothetical protein [Flavobacteriaceae bacterium]